MLVLDATTKSITIVMDVAAATTNPDYIVSFADITTTTFTPIGGDGALNGTTPVTVIAAPASSTQRQVKEIVVNNRDTVAHAITVNYVDNGTNRQLLKWILGVGDTLLYTDNTGWRVLDSLGGERSGGVVMAPTTLLSGNFAAANTSTTLSMTSTTAYAVWLGCAKAASTSITLRYRVTTACATITYAEAAIFKGAINIGGNPTLTRLGYADISAVANSTGQKSTVVTLSTSCAIGDDLWAVFGDQATTTMVLRAGLADDIQTGGFATLTTTRPSTATSPTAWTIAGNTVAVPWVKAFIN